MFEAEGPRGRPVAQVLLDSALPQLDHLFDYAVPAGLTDDIRVGHRVRVPFRSQNRQSFGYVIGFVDRSEFGGELQAISEIVGEVPQLTPEVWRLARTLADRAGGSANDILRLAIPKRAVRVEKQHLAALRARGAGDQRSNSDGSTPVEGRSETEAASAADTATKTGAAPLTHVEPSDTEQATAQLLCSGARLAISASHGPARLETGEWVGGWALQMARLALAVFIGQRSVIIVTPDYRAADQVADALFALGHTETVRIDSRQSGSARYSAFLRARDAQPRIILGNRSAVYAPAHDLGAIMMWDDGDPLLSEPLSPYVHARDAALVRAQQAATPVGLAFAGHTRSVEVQRLVNIGYVQSEAVPPRRTRVIAVDDMQHTEAFSPRVPEFAARTIREGLAHGPVLVQVATPGYAPVAVCADCGERARCDDCSGPLAFADAHRLACRWCGTHALRWRCKQCGGDQLSQRGAGSARTAEQFQQQFAGARIVLSDGAHPHERVDSRPAIVVATRGAEPIAAGGYRAVVLLDAERLLSIESLRAGEDCLRWWHNAAALAAPDARCVIASGGGPVVKAFATGREEEWLRAELADRHELRYPPAVRVASVTGGRAEVERAIAALGDLSGVDVLGPSPHQSAAPSAQAQSQTQTQTQTQTPGTTYYRAIVRFEYAQGAEVAKRLRGALVADAAGSSSRVGGRTRYRNREEALRLRFDDRGVFDF